MPKGIYKRKPLTELHKANISKGLIGNTRRFGHPHTKETKEKIRKSTLGKLKSEETRQKMKQSARRGPKHPMWKGGRYLDKKGYIRVSIDGGSYREHRVVFEKFLGRKLHQHEDVHHINGIKDDNRIENLQLVFKKKHYGNLECPNCHFKFKIK